MGIDEVGRGPLAGPVAAAAVHFPEGARIPRVNDSKLLKEQARLELRDAILAVSGVRWALAVVEAEEIDRINILRATDLAMRRAALAVDGADFILVDGRPVPHLPHPSLAIVKGDRKSASIAAASILAKVWRDAFMDEQDARYPEYGFARHKGYGTAAHLDALRKWGPCPLHRRSFRPVRELLDEVKQQELF